MERSLHIVSDPTGDPWSGQCKATPKYSLLPFLVQQRLRVGFLGEPQMLKKQPNTHSAVGNAVVRVAKMVDEISPQHSERPICSSEDFLTIS
jgi:hypothetical protein